jgi:hypothetical protein
MTGQEKGSLLIQVTVCRRASIVINWMNDMEENFYLGARINYCQKATTKKCFCAFFLIVSSNFINRQSNPLFSNQ